MSTSTVESNDVIRNSTVTSTVQLTRSSSPVVSAQNDQHKTKRQTLDGECAIGIAFNQDQTTSARTRTLCHRPKPCKKQIWIMQNDLKNTRSWLRRGLPHPETNFSFYTHETKCTQRHTAYIELAPKRTNYPI